ncbi:MAG: YiiX/YebB-like N1pC/P60 family cysteine hydrolase [Pseudomonadota bacterium]
MQSSMPKALGDSIDGLISAVSQLQDDAPTRQTIDAIVARREFRPSEDEAVGFWFARFLTIRQNLWALIDDVRALVDKPLRAIGEEDELRYFLIGYAAVCLLVRIDRLLLFELGEHSIIQRKLNEAFPEYRIPRKQFTRIFSAFVDPIDALTLRDAMLFVDKNREKLLAMSEDAAVGPIARQLPQLETSLDPSKRAHLKRTSSYVSHSWRRRGVVSAERLLAGVLEGFGRAASEFCEMDNKQVTAEIRDELAAFLLPGDVIVTRHAKALTNLFFPGFWPHAALYVGTPEQRGAGNISADPDHLALWVDDICVLEARKDGVLLRPLHDTLAVDCLTVLRPNIAAASISTAIGRALQHEGKLYNFDFNFFNSDRVVCTEVIYRAYDGLEGLAFPLQERAGRKTLYAEDLLDYALESGAFAPAALFGVESCRDSVLYGDAVRDALVASYRKH